MAKLNKSELKQLWLKGSVTSNGKVLSFEEMVFQYHAGNTILISTGDEVIKITPPLPMWMIAIGVSILPVLFVLTNNALRVAGY